MTQSISSFNLLEITAATFPFQEVIFGKINQRECSPPKPSIKGPLKFMSNLLLILLAKFGSATTVWPCVGHQRRRPAGYPTCSLLCPISRPRWPMFFKYALETWKENFGTSKSIFCPPKCPMEGSWCGKLRSAARYHRLSGLSQVEQLYKAL